MDGLPRPPAIPQIQYLLASKTLILPTTATAATVFASLPFQTANKGQIIIDRVELSRFELKGELCCLSVGGDATAVV